MRSKSTNNHNVVNNNTTLNPGDLPSGYKSVFDKYKSDDPFSNAILNELQQTK